MRHCIIILLFIIGESCASSGNKDKGKEEQREIIRPLNEVENKIIGTWKLTYASYPVIYLPNFPGEYRTLGLKLDSARRVIFYLDNFKDSVAEYEWSADSSALTLLKGDVLTKAKLIDFNDSSLSFIIEKVVEDSLYFRRLQ